MKVAFFTEGVAFGKVPRNFLNMRTDMAWMCALDAIRIPYRKAREINQTFDLGICIIPKELDRGHEAWALEPGDIEVVKSLCKKIATMQEGPQWHFQDYPLHKQIWYYNTLQEMDFLFVHNEVDKKYFKGLTDKECKVMPSLMIEDAVDIHSLVHENDRKDVIIGGNFCQWYGGFDSYMIAQEFDCPINIPSMGRKIEGEEQMENLHHLSYMNWREWITSLSRFKYGVHLMRTHAAGTFALNCAYLGIPCIGYKGLDTQMICHPHLSIEIGDLQSAKILAKKLKEDKEFYSKCSNLAKKMYESYYKEDIFLGRFKDE